MYVCFPLLSHTSESYTSYSTVSLSGNLISKSENVILAGIIGDPSALYGSIKFLKTIQQVVLLIIRDNTYGATLQGQGKDSFYSHYVIVITMLGKSTKKT
jgi:hypothetical protein